MWLDDATAAQVAAVVALAFAGVFVGLVILDVQRSRQETAQPVRIMLSEVAYNAFVTASTALFPCGALLTLARWVAPTVAEGGWLTLLVTLGLGLGAMALLRAAATHAEALPTAPVPDFMRCDGDFLAVAGEPNPLASWCGYLRFEGHGVCRIQPSADAPGAPLVAEWSVHAIDTLRIEPLPPGRADLPLLFVRGGEVGLTDASLSETLELAHTASGPAVCRLSFVPDEDDGHG